MSHAYSFCLITAFMYHCNVLVNSHQTNNLFYAALLFGLILLVRVNNGLVLFSVFFWFTSKEQCLSFFKSVFRNRAFYASVGVLLLVLSIQPLTWLVKENVLFANRYAPYGF